MYNVTGTGTDRPHILAGVEAPHRALMLPAALDALSREVDGLESTVGAFIARLAPVCRQDSPRPGDGAENSKDPSSPVAVNSLHQEIRRIYALRSLLQHILETLEV